MKECEECGNEGMKKRRNEGMNLGVLLYIEDPWSRPWCGSNMFFSALKWLESLLFPAS